MRRNKLLLVAPLGLASAAACSVITDLDAIHVKDGGVADTSVSVDSGADAHDAKPADAATFCTGKDADFCADFDESSNLQVGWDNNVSNGGATLVESTTNFASPPRAVHASIGNVVSDAGLFATYANLGKSFALNGKTRVRIEADVRFESAAFGSNDYTQYFTWIGQATLGGPSIGATGIVRDSAHGWTVVILTAGLTYLPMTTSPPTDKWTHMVAEVVLGVGSAGSVWVAFDGVTALALTPVGTTKSAASDVGIAAGFAAPSGYSPKIGVTYDNVLVTLLP